MLLYWRTLKKCSSILEKRTHAILGSFIIILLLRALTSLVLFALKDDENEDMVFRMDSIIEIALRDVCLLIFLYMVQRIKLIEVQVNQSIVSADEIISKLRK